MAQETFEICLDGDGFRIIPVTEDQVRLTALLFRVADPVHFRPDPDPAAQDLKSLIRILLALTKNQFKHLNF